jgi:hypothetical protein
MIVSETQIIQAMQYWEDKHIAEHGPLDKISIPKACSQLADVLGVMWFSHESEVQIKDTSKLAELINSATNMPTIDKIHA